MNRRSLFKSLAAVPLGLLAPLKGRALPATPIQPPALPKKIDMSKLEGFVPRDGLAYLHKGEPRVTCTFFIGTARDDTVKQMIERDEMLARRRLH